MNSSNEIVIKDSCILFDLTDLELLDSFFNLNLIVLTTPQVYGEITSEVQYFEISKFVRSGQLIIDPTGELEKINEINELSSGLSIADSSVLELALRKNAVILSSDGILRKVSIKKEVTVRGMLWIIEELLNKKIIDTVTALEKLSIYKKVNMRAPTKEIENLIEKLTK